MKLFDQTEEISITQEMKNSFLDYSMSVIVSRALPDVRDGLKPVHRRILVTMNDLELTPGRPYRKCAKICGDVNGNYHPHGDQVIYPSLVRLAQPFSLRYPLVDGQGNFGSVDGDPPAAQRYTEARMTRVTQRILEDLKKDTVDYVPNYDGERLEPTVLPCVVPNLLVNGSDGIAVGMATKIPPHNMTEVLDALIHLIDNPEAQVRDLIQFVKGPDFPTGGTIMGKKGIHDAYLTGRGRIVIRCKSEVEVEKTRERIIITEIPYQVNKSTLISRIADLVREKKIEGIHDLRDESDRTGMRIVIELKKGENADIILNQLYKHTQLQDTFGVIMLALDNGRPKVLNLREMLVAFLQHRREVVTRRTRHELAKAEARAHILEGFKIALDNIDEVITIIRAAADVPTAREGLMTRFKLSERQANAILEMRLQRLTGLERDKIEEEYQKLIKEIERLKSILANEGLLLQVIKEEFTSIRDEFGDERRTMISSDGAQDFVDEDLIPDEDMVVMITHQGYIKRTDPSAFRTQGRRGKGMIGIQPREGDFVEHLFHASNHDTIMVFTDIGKCHWVKVHQIPEVGRSSYGRNISNLVELEPGERLMTILVVRDFPEDQYLLFVTKRGYVKKTELSQYGRVSRRGIIAIKIEDDDELVGVRKTNGNDEVFLATARGKAIRFNEEDVRPMGRSSRGVIGIKFGQRDDEVVGLCVAEEGHDILTITERGYGKRTEVEEYRLQGRGGQGVINTRVTKKNGDVVGILSVEDGMKVMMITSAGKLIRIPIDDSLRKIGRSTQGVLLQNLPDDESVAAVGKIIVDPDEENADPDELLEQAETPDSEGESPTEDENGGASSEDNDDHDGQTDLFDNQ